MTQKNFPIFFSPIFSLVSTRSCVTMMRLTAKARFLPQRLYSAQAATQQNQKNIESSSPQIFVNKLKTGLTIATCEDKNPVSKISVVFKAGCRFETGANLGVTHALRVAAELTNEETSAFGLAKAVGQMGAAITAATTRDHMIYTVECLREQLEDGLKFLGNVIAQPSFLPWEVQRIAPRMHMDISALRSCPRAEIMELVHDAAFQTGVGRSLYSPADMVGRHTPDMLSTYVRDHYRLGESMAVVASSVEHELLVELVQVVMRFNVGSTASPTPAAYTGGEIRRNTTHDKTHTAVVSKGVGISNEKEAVAAAILKEAISPGSAVKYAGSSGKLFEAMSKSGAEQDFTLSVINANHSDSGLFGFYCESDYRDVEKLLGAAVKYMRSVAKSGIPEQQVESAKQRVKTVAAMLSENYRERHDAMIAECVTNGKVTGVDDFFKMVDGVSAGEVNAVAKKVLNGKPSMVAMGNLDNTPSLDKLVGM